jgi:hypothetical protein
MPAKKADGNGTRDNPNLNFCEVLWAQFGFKGTIEVQHSQEKISNFQRWINARSQISSLKASARVPRPLTLD